MAALSQVMSFEIIGWLGFEGEPPITIFDGEVGRPSAATRLVTAHEKVDVDCVFRELAVEHGIHLVRTVAEAVANFKKCRTARS
jgi:hypothetical protein